MLVSLILAASASAPAHLPVQARLLDSQGAPIEDPTAVTFSLYSAQTGGSALYSEMLTVDPEAGYFSVFLGQVTPLDWSIVDGSTPLFLGITLADAPELTRQPVGTVPFAAFADQAGDAQTVDGLDVPGLMAQVASDYPSVLDPYADADAVAAMGAASDSNPLNHSRYTDAEVSAVIGPQSESNSRNHARYTDAEAVSAMGSTSNGNTRNHARYSDSEARSTIAAEDRYVRNSGDDVTGTLTAGALVSDVDVTAGRDVRYSGLIYDDDSNLGVHLIKMRFGRGTGGTANIINFTDANGTTHTLDIGGGAANNGVIAYTPGSTGVDGSLYFNIESSSSLECTLLHAEDDAPLPGFYYSTDGGNQWNGIWGNQTTRTFAIRREGVTGSPLTTAQAFAILCF